MPQAFVRVFSGEYRRRTILNSIYLIASIAGLWAGSTYVPQAITYIAERSNASAAEAARLASYGTALMGFSTIVGAVITPWLAKYMDRRTTLAFFFVIMLIFIPVTYGYIFYMPEGALPWFMVGTFFLGLGGANFVVYSFWLPEQYGTECRVSAFAFTTNIGRFAGAGLTYLVGVGVHHYGTLGSPVAMIGALFGVALLLLPFGVETRGKPLPA